MRYQVFDAQLLATPTSGQIVPSLASLPHNQGQRLPQAAAINQAMNDLRDNLEVPEDATGTEAIRHARVQLQRLIQERIGDGAAYTVAVDDAITYRPLFDQWGNIIGHTTDGLLLREGQPVLELHPDAPGAVLFASINLSIVDTRGIQNEA